MKKFVTSSYVEKKEETVQVRGTDGGPVELTIPEGHLRLPTFMIEARSHEGWMFINLEGPRQRRHGIIGGYGTEKLARETITQYGVRDVFYRIRVIQHLHIATVCGGQDSFGKELMQDAELL